MCAALIGRIGDAPEFHWGRWPAGCPWHRSILSVRHRARLQALSRDQICNPSIVVARVGIVAGWYGILRRRSARLPRPLGASVACWTICAADSEFIRVPRSPCFLCGALRVSSRLLQWTGHPLWMNSRYPWNVRLIRSLKDNILQRTPVSRAPSRNARRHHLWSYARSRWVVLNALYRW